MRQTIAIIFLFILYVSHANGEIPDTMAERVKACTICHDDEGKIGRDAYYPRIGGKPAGYLFNQLRNFRDGRRYYQPMAILLENMSDEYMLEIANYFSALQLPFPPSEQISLQANEVELAESLIYYGNTERNIPACSACHGEALMGVNPFIPGLLGLPRAYIVAQLGSWRNGGFMRGQASNCMSEIAKQLSDDETNAVAKWLAAQPAAGEPSPANLLSTELAHRCHSIVHENGDAE